MPILYPVVEEWVTVGNQRAHELHRSAEYEKAEVQYRALLPWANGQQRPVLLNNLGMLLRDNGRMAEAHPLLEESLRLRVAMYGETHTETLIALSNLGSLRGAMGDWKEAGRIFRQVLGERQKSSERPNQALADTLINVALVEKLEGRFESALALLEEAKEVLPKGSNRSLATIHNNLASNLIAIGKKKEGRRQLDLALEQTESEHPIRAQILVGIANLETSMGHPRQARVALAEATEIESNVFKPGHPRHEARETVLAWIEFVEGAWDSAETRLSRIHRQEVDVHELRARIALKRKDDAKAIAHLERAFQIGRNDHSGLKGCLALYAKLMRKQEQYAQAAMAEQKLITLETRSALADYRGGLASVR